MYASIDRVASTLEEVASDLRDYQRSRRWQQAFDDDLQTEIHYAQHVLHRASWMVPHLQLDQVIRFAEEAGMARRQQRPKDKKSKG